ncbi:hypothetical protein GCM10027277_30110 [Pseudoduganella ginsengisoli]
MPDPYVEPGIYPNRNHITQTNFETIDPFSGALNHQYTDIFLPGNGGFDLSVIRSYNSTAAQPGVSHLAGLGWNIHFGRVLQPWLQNDPYNDVCNNSDATVIGDNPVLEMQDGGRQMLAFTGTSPLMISTRQWRVDCQASPKGLVVYSPDGMRYEMTQKVKLPNGVTGWYTTKITDRNGNYAIVSYKTPDTNEITRVDTNDGRWVTFEYLDSGLTGWTRVSRIQASGNQYLNYAYDQVPNYPSSFQLTSVTRPDGFAWKYEYNTTVYAPNGGPYAMKKVTTPEGGSTSYEYTLIEFDRFVIATGTSKITVNSAVTKKTVSPISPYSTISPDGVWTFKYTPSATAGVYDMTTMTAPDGKVTTYRHYGPRYTADGIGTVWMVGLLMSKDIDGKQTETYSWTKQRISGEKYYRLGAYEYKRSDPDTSVPLLSQKVITRDGATYSTTYSNYDAYGNPGQVAESGPNGGSRTTTLTYNINTNKWLVKQVKDESFPGSSITRSFDTNGNLLSQTRDGVSTSYTYDAQGNVATVTYPRSLTHTLSNYKRGIPQSESQPEGVNITRVVSDAGNITSETNGDQRTTTYGYDLQNRLTSITRPAGDAVSISYTGPTIGYTSKIVTRGTLKETTQYDGFMRPISVDLGGVVRTTTYDNNGRKNFESNPGASIGTKFQQYDGLGRVGLITNADNTTRTFTYGAGTRTVTDERNNATTETLRGYGNPDQTFVMGISKPDASANVTLARNSKDLVTSVTQAGLTRSYGYNSNYYLTSVTDPETGTTTYGRDAAGNMTSRTVGASGTTNYTYDNQNRLTAVSYPNGAPAVSKTYSKTHRLLTVNSSSANRSYAYDANNNLTSESVVVDGRTFTTGYGYNTRDQLQSITYPQSGKVVSYAPDALGRPTQVSGYITSVSYWPSGMPKQINYANGTVTEYDQHSRLWPSTFRTQKSGTYYVNSSYGYDGMGNLSSISDSADGSYNRSFGYDSLDRLTTANGPWGSGTIAYNGAGNITSQVLGGSNLYYSYTDGTNRLNSVTGSRTTTYGYDAYGNVTSGSGNTYTYDGVPNLTCVNCGNAAAKIEYTYDGLNRRVSATKAGVKTYEVYGSHGNQLIEFTPSQSNRLVEYIYLGGKRIAQRVTP